jgi:uncharacterized damage-inducible protein DinB
MEISSMNSFLRYYEKIRQGTIRVIQAIPEDKIDWTYKHGKFTFADLIRHIAAIERYVFAEVAIGNKPSYKGCGKELADGYDLVIAYFYEMHKQSIERFQAITDESLKQKIKSLDGKEITLGNFIRSLIVHEVHHRGAMCIYLNLIGVQSPPVIGLTEEQVIQASKN